MAARPGDGTKEVAVTDKEPTPKDRRVPLKVVAFNQMTSVPGAASMMSVVEFGESRLMGGATFVCPQPFYDPATRTIWIEGREYPLERVHYWERAKMATSKKPAPAEHNHRIGRVARPETPTK